MKQTYLLFRKLLLLAWCFALLFSFSYVQAQSIDKLEQYANGALKDVTFTPTTNTGWVTGNVNAAKAHYACGMTIPYRLQVSGLTSGETYRVKIGFDITKDFKHAIDFMTSFDRPDLHSATFGHSPENVIGDVLVDTDLEAMGLDPFNDFATWPIPAPDNSIPTSIGLQGPIDGFNEVVGDGYGFMKIYNGTVSAMQFVGGDPSANTSSDYYWVDFTPNEGETVVLLAWGGHIACEDLWGPGSSAADINGSPYHMFIADCEMLSGCGSKEVQLSATAVIAYTAPTCEVIATDVECFGESTGSLDITVGGDGTAPYWIYVFEDSAPGTPVYEGVTDGSGNYSLGGLQAGPYTVYSWNEEQNVGLEDPSECRDTIYQAEECTVTISPPASYDLGCNGNWPDFLTADVLVDCGSDGSTNTTVDSDGGVLQAAQGCLQTMLYTFTYTDDCGNTDTKTTTVTMTEDLVAPTNDDCDAGADLGCNPDPADYAADDFPTWTDDCGTPSSGVVVGTPVADAEGCGWSVTHKYWATDACLNSDTCYQTFTWVEDTEAPQFENCPVTVDLGCMPLAMPTAEDAIAAVGEVLDDCSNVTVSAVGGPITGTCELSQVWTVTADADCGPDAICEVTFTWEIESISGDCETAFGKLPDDNALCFIPVFNRWGWTNYISEAGTYDLNLYPGAAHCVTDGIEPVGVIHVMYDDEKDSVSVVYEMYTGQYLSEVHVYVGYNKYPELNAGKKSKPTVAPGKYNVVVEGEGVYSGAEVAVTNVTDAFYIIVHGVVCPLECSCEYGEADEFGILTGEGVAYPGFDGDLSTSTMVDNKAKKKSADIILGVEPVIEDSEFKVFPNPFDEVVNFEFVPAVSGHAVLEIHNMLGQRVVRLLDQPVEAGELQRVEFRPDSEISGMYLYRLDIDGDVRIGKLIYRNR